MKIFLIGFMGSGKSRKGRDLSLSLGWPLLDLDDEIMAQTGLSITEIFAQRGEAGFRALESELLRNHPYPEDVVVAVGGGLPCFHDNMQWMNAHGCTVYLKMQPKALLSRLNKREKRPLIAGMSDPELLHFIELKLSEREPYYMQARIIVDGLNLTTESLRSSLGLDGQKESR